MKNKKIVFFDTETSGLDIEDKIVQLAFSYQESLKNNYGNFHLNKLVRVTEEDLFYPGVLISPEAAMITGISNSTVEGKNRFINQPIYHKMEALIKEENTYFVAYNAPFDTAMLEKDNIVIPNEKVIDLYRVVKHLYKDERITDRYGKIIPLANNKLQYFRYLLEFDDRQGFKNLVFDYGVKELQSHTALSDIVVLEYFFYFVKERFELSFEQMLELSNTPVLESYISFGNVFEKGTSFKECLTTPYEQYGRMKNGYDYLDWCSSSLTLSLDTHYSIKIHFFNALIEGLIPYNKNFAKYINYGLVFETESTKIERALQLIEQDEKYLDLVKTKFKEKLHQDIEESKTDETIDKSTPQFLSRYLNMLNN
jgi:DNA polymerase III epsilon subunit-like protein